MDRKIKLLSTLRNASLSRAKTYKEDGDLLEYHRQMEKASAYASALYILTDKDYFETLCQIWDIE